MGFYDGGNEISVQHETKPRANGQELKADLNQNGPVTKKR
jgi:hypothetical protein